VEHRLAHAASAYLCSGFTGLNLDALENLRANGEIRVTGKRNETRIVPV
jgi:predicted NodU family carbamoyl transferase